MDPFRSQYSMLACKSSKNHGLRMHEGESLGHKQYGCMQSCYRPNTCQKKVIESKTETEDAPDS